MVKTFKCNEPLPYRVTDGTIQIMREDQEQLLEKMAKYLSLLAKV